MSDKQELVADFSNADLRMLVAALTEFAETSLPAVARLIPATQEQTDAFRANVFQLRHKVQRTLRERVAPPPAATPDTPA